MALITGMDFDGNVYLCEMVLPTSSNPAHRATESLERKNNESIEEFLSLALHPEEVLLNRYATMIYISLDNGRIYEELAGASMCPSCAEKTFLCPHKIQSTSVISLPKHCTHIKICRPHAHRVTLAAKVAGNRAVVDRETICASMASSRIGSQLDCIPRRDGTENTQKPSGDKSSQSASPPSSWQRSWTTEADFSKLKQPFEKRLKFERESPRLISLNLCRSLAEHLLASLLRQGDSETEVTGILSIQDLLWNLIKNRYISEEISSLGLHDFLAAVWKYSADSKVLFVLRQVLLGQLDPAVLIYVLLQAQKLNALTFTDTTEIQHFLALSYHFLQETEQDSLVLEFTAYSNRSKSSEALLGFILHLILQQREPLILECEDMLSFYSKTHRALLTSKELTAAIDELSPLSSQTQVRTLIQQSLLCLGSSCVPIHHAAHIVACLMERERAKKRREQLEMHKKKKDDTEFYLKSLHDVIFQFCRLSPFKSPALDPGT
ncbi:uncharacterized protein RCH25_009495 [Pelodytes ibericus]